jgi:hypothetical protein
MGFEPSGRVIHSGPFFAHPLTVELRLNEDGANFLSGFVRTCAVREASKTGKTDNKRITAFYWLEMTLRKFFIQNKLPRMDSNHDKVIQSHLSYSEEMYPARLVVPARINIWFG